MATTSPHIHKEAPIPFWRDVRILGIIGQIVFLIVVLAGVGWLISNFIENSKAQGLKIGFEFLNSTAGFEIGEGIDYKATDSFGRALWVGVINTLKVSFIGIVLTMILGTSAGIARLSNNWLINKVATIYIETVRNIPLLVQLFFIYFAVILKLPSVKDSIQPFGLPIFLNQRGFTLPGLTPTVGFPVWLAFIVLAFIMVLVLWNIQTRQEEQTGEHINKISNAVIAFVIIVAVGWFVTGAFLGDQAIMVATTKGVKGFNDFEAVYLRKIDKDALKNLGIDLITISSFNSARDVADYKKGLLTQLEAKDISAEKAQLLKNQLNILNDAVITICSVSDTPGQINAVNKLYGNGIPVKVIDEKTIGKAGVAYSAGKCDLLASTQAELAAERVVLENPSTYELVPVSISPVVVNIPLHAGFNIKGGAKLSPEFAALLIGLVLYTSAFSAEIVRAGILAVSKGQSEAARALGLNESQRLILVVIPQALRVIIPPMTSQFLNLTKNSTLAVAIAYPDLVSVGSTVLNQSGFAVQVIIIFMASYLTISLSISAFLNWYNKKVALVER